MGGGGNDRYWSGCCGCKVVMLGGGGPCGIAWLMGGIYEGAAVSTCWSCEVCALRASTKAHLVRRWSLPVLSIGLWRVRLRLPMLRRRLVWLRGRILRWRRVGAPLPSAGARIGIHGR